ncbi:MAG: dockerin type I domain-containing protein [Planctomycetaceae bacterium]
MNDERQLDDSNNGLPDSVRAALKNRYGPIPSVPSEIDNAILADARRHFEQHGPATLLPARRRRVSAWQWTAIATTVTAACVMLFALRPQQPDQESSVATRSDASLPDNDLRGDVDLNGRVDILDAFAMARQFRDGSAEHRDFNHDGRFDELDIDLVAHEAVKL